KRKWGRRFIAASLIVIFLLSEVIYNAQYLQGALLNQPLTISHRGVDDGNGVQNTIPALNRTSKEHPNFVEMDIHETKDHQFVVMHDENLANLAGVNAAPYQLTLQQMTSMKVHENGYTAHIASFDQYLRAAERDHQRLLVEIKTTSHDSPNMLQLFIHRYERRLLHDHDQIHSLDYHVISGLKKHAPKLFVSYILPYNFSFPETKANAYTMEETTLNSQFVSEAHRRNQWVYAWTVDDSDDMTKMLFLNVDGIITDNLSELQATIKSTFNHPSYAHRLLVYSNELQNESPAN
ncbi:glycerophosphodiester phosphodiesterase, partial [Lentilactobacillus parafarraginis]